MTPHLKTQLKSLPPEPGIYKYFDADGVLIYVGKAVNLKNRVSSYFTGNDHSPKTKVLVSRIVRLETIVVQSEIDALILETNLIKQFRPRYNIILKDDKSHLYIKITLYEELPRVSTCRQTDMSRDPKATYFGPFPSGGTVKQTLRYLRRIFPYVARHQPPVPGRRRPPQSYFYYNLPLGPVDKQIDVKQYRQQIFSLVHFLEGRRLQVAAELEKEMKAAAKRLDFEQASSIKQQLDGLAYISQQTIRPESYVANPELMADKREQGLSELADALAPYFQSLQRESIGVREQLEADSNGLSEQEDSHRLRRIECYDISNTGGKQAVGSMVVFTDGQPLKSDYRRFRIRREQVPNDVAMLQEVLHRRLHRLGSRAEAQESDAQPKLESDTDLPVTAETELPPKNSKADRSFASWPDLIMVDGGKGQLSAATEVLAELDLKIPVVGMSKREEELIIRPIASDAYQPDEVEYIPDPDALTQSLSGRSPKPKRSSAHGAIARTAEEAATKITTEANFTSMKLARGSEALFLIQRIRDEAHRFAITYHRKLRAKNFLPPSTQK